MNKQMTISLISDELRQAATPKKELLERMDRIIPWSRWTELVQPYYYKGEHGNKPYPLERMLRIYVIQDLYNLADMAAKNEIIDSRAFSDFCGVDSSNQVPDGDTIGRFRNILKANSLQDKLFDDYCRRIVRRLFDQSMYSPTGVLKFCFLIFRITEPSDCSASVSILY